MVRSVNTLKRTFLVPTFIVVAFACSSTDQEAPQEPLANSEVNANLNTQSDGDLSENSNSGANYEQYNAVIDNVESDLGDDYQTDLADESAANVLGQYEDSQVNGPYYENDSTVDVPLEGANDSLIVTEESVESLSGNAENSVTANQKKVSTRPSSGPSRIWWVGYDYQKQQKLVRIEILTKGDPKFKFSQQRNKAGQPELVVSYEYTKLRKKIQRDIDASEFPSPVAYVRMEEDLLKGTASVVLTLRDNIQPEMNVSQGGLLLTYKIPERYFGVASQAGVSSGEAVSLDNAVVLPVGLSDGSLAPAYVPDPVQTVFKTAPDNGEEVFVELDQQQDETEQAMQAEVIGELQLKETAQTQRELPIEGVSASDEATVSKKKVTESNQDNRKLPAVSRPEPMPVQPQPTAPYVGTPYPAQPYPAQPGLQQPRVNRGVAKDVNPSDRYENDEQNAPQLDMESPTLDEFDSDETGDDADNFEVRLRGLEEELIVRTFHVGWVAQDTGIDPLVNDELGQSGEYETYANEYDVQPAADSELIGADTGSSGETFTGKPIRLNFTDAKLDHVLKVFAQESGYNFVVPQRIGQTIRVSLNLKNVPWDMALKAVLESEGLAMTRIGDRVIRVDKISSVNDYLKAEDEAKKVRAAVTQQKVLILRLNHARAEDLASSVKIFMDTQTAGATKSSVAVDTRTNSLILESLPEILVKAQAVVERLDVPVPQAEISTRIVEVSKDTANFLGLNWQGGSNYDASAGLGFGSLPFPNFATSNFAVDTGQATTAGDFRLRLGSINDVLDLDLRLKMEERKGTAEILQSGKVVVQDGKSASITAGTTVYTRPVVVAGVSSEGDANQAGQLQPIDFSLKLKIGEGSRGISISREGRVTMPILIENSLPNSSGSALQADTRRLETEIVKNTGETAVIGGIYNTTKRETVVAVPFLSKIPILGALFRSKEQSESQTELLIMITPTVIEAFTDGTATASESLGSQNYYNSGDASVETNAGANNFGANVEANSFSENGNGEYYENTENSNQLTNGNNATYSENANENVVYENNTSEESNVANENQNNTDSGSNTNGAEYAAYEANVNSVSNSTESNNAVNNEEEYYENNEQAADENSANDADSEIY